MSACSDALSGLPAEEELKDKALVRETENEAVEREGRGEGGGAQLDVVSCKEVPSDATKYP